jgi:hypothetical protein
MQKLNMQKIYNNDLNYMGYKVLIINNCIKQNTNYIKK